MPDHAISSSPAVQAQLDRLASLSPGRDVLGLERIRSLCARLGHPERRLPPVFHVAGTNGKGSTCAFLRAMLEAAGYRVHSYTSPHLVRFNERIRLAGQLIADDDLAAVLARTLDAADGLNASFFEITTAAALLRFAEVPADACVIEVGLGGRLDATNVIEDPLVCGIASLGIDHKEFLLAPEAGVPADPLVRIAFEKAGIAKQGAPLVTQAYPLPMEAAIADAAHSAGAPMLARGSAWDAKARGGQLHYRDAAGEFTLPLPAMAGAHQADNAALAVAMLRAQTLLAVPEAALGAGITSARWPARMQRLGAGPLTELAPGRELWLDGGHNPDAARALASWLAAHGPVDLIVGLLANKDASGFLGPMAPHVGAMAAVPVPGHSYHEPRDLCAMVQARLGITFAQPCASLEQAVAHLARDGGDRPILIAGSLYLAGEALRINAEWPD